MVLATLALRYKFCCLIFPAHPYLMRTVPAGRFALQWLCLRRHDNDRQVQATHWPPMPHTARCFRLLIVGPLLLLFNLKAFVHKSPTVRPRCVLFSQPGSGQGPSWTVVISFHQQANLFMRSMTCNINLSALDMSHVMHCQSSELFVHASYVANIG